MPKFCFCPHIAHTDPHARTPAGLRGHEPLIQVGETIPIMTPDRGEVYVCQDCADDCLMCEFEKFLT
jgi:hypothetical protein